MEPEGGQYLYKTLALNNQLSIPTNPVSKSVYWHERVRLHCVGAKAKTLPFARRLHRLATPTKTTPERAESAGRMMTDVVTLRPLHCKTKARLRRILLVPRPHRAQRPMWDSAHCNGPHANKRVTSLVCNILFCNDGL
jgi:hypothetical protein